MGGGDMKLFGVLGVILGVKKVLLTFFIACFGGAFVGIILLRLGKIKQKQPIPFAPFIMFAASISYFYGELIIPQYLSLFILESSAIRLILCNVMFCLFKHPICTMNI